MGRLGHDTHIGSKFLSGYLIPFPGKVLLGVVLELLLKGVLLMMIRKIPGLLLVLLCRDKGRS